MHLRRSGEGWHSEVANRGFFLAGAPLDPERERLALATALSKTSSTLPSEASDPRCRFPARTRLLARELGLGDPLQTRCPSLTTWHRDLAAESISIVYSGQFAGNPASFMGHLFLKMRSERPHWPGTPLALLDQTFGFVALVPPGTGQLAYIWRGLTGGFRAAFVRRDFSDVGHEYQVLESRDLWEYQLRLGPEETSRLLDHLWELGRQAQFPYRFLDLNCASMIAELVAVARPALPPPPGDGRPLAPQTVLSWLRDHELIAVAQAWPSLRTEAAARLASLDATERRRLAHDTSKGAVTLGQSARYYDALVTQLDFVRTQSRREATLKLAQLHEQALRLLAAATPLPVNGAPAPFVSDPSASHGLSRALVSVGTDERSPFLGVAMRLAAHGISDPEAGFDRHLGFEVGDIQGRLRPGRLQQPDLTALELFRLRALTPMTELTQDIAWDVSLGFTDPSAPRYNGGFIHADAAVGAALEPTTATLLWLLPKATLRRTKLSADWGAGIAVGSLIGLNRGMRLALDAHMLALWQLWASEGHSRDGDHVQGAMVQEYSATLVLAAPLTRHVDVRLSGSGLLQRSGHVSGPRRLDLAFGLAQYF